jgi:signal recognition particle receptor subunit beta
VVIYSFRGSEIAWTIQCQGTDTAVVMITKNARNDMRLNNMNIIITFTSEKSVVKKRAWNNNNLKSQQWVWKVRLVRTEGCPF